MKKIDVVCAIIKIEKRYLIARRGKGVRENIWEFPGGKVEINETKEEAVVREIKEELAWDIKVDTHLIDIIDQRDDIILQVSAYICEYIKGEMCLHAHHEVRFVKANELYEYTFEDADKAILDALVGTH